MSILARRRNQQPSQFQRAADGSMTLMEHLRELRSRLFKACLAILIGIIVAWFFAQHVLTIIQDPYCELALKQTMKANGNVVPEGYRCPFVNLKVTDPLLLQLKISLWTGLILACPFWLYQLWAFIAPGLHRNERRWAYVFASLAAPLFALGSVLAFYVVKTGLEVLLSFTGTNTSNILEAMAYVDFVTGMMLVFGVAFEFPLGVMLANIAGIVTGKRLLGWWRVAVFTFFVFAAIATPTADPFGMTFLALCLSALYFGAVAFAIINDRRRGRNQPAYANIGDDEASSLDDYEVEPVAAATSVGGYDPIEPPTPVDGPTPVERPQSLDRRYDDVT
ncbi:twin-arginine translocase subunit TatC [Dactylosporangium roseum]|uniref:Sec-independent protein translocase protein TatC n=2 Tax=Dactylosporangium roseum TaxID=47989 RepID=A0ABY5ZEK1_9ACTN|nr:twin-arginine translocase subunit TatC [Dactylosporangium roseum]UWZ39847.1 twin-arginine translocase subunit TatC [Dactylosporangium roseum]